MKLQLTNIDLCAEIDAEDLPKILAHSSNWSMGFSPYRNGKFTAIKAWSKLYGRSINLTWAILGRHKGMEIDHIDRNPFNNQKSNLRIITKSQNNQNKGPNLGRKYKGVCFVKKHSTWKVSVTRDGESYQKWGFKTEAEAALHANVILKRMHGIFAYQNTINTEEVK